MLCNCFDICIQIEDNKILKPDHQWSVKISKDSREPELNTKVDDSEEVLHGDSN